MTLLTGSRSGKNTEDDQVGSYRMRQSYSSGEEKGLYYKSLTEQLKILIST